MEIDPTHFRVAVFGSARIRKGDPRYKLVYDLAKRVAGAGWDVVTGGGPGLMDAASRGHHAGRKGRKLNSIGLAISLPHEQSDSWHLEIKREHSRFSQRLDSFMELSNAVVVAPGGIGTLLELFYTWQLVQTEFICETPIILLGTHWGPLLAWIKKEMVGKRLMSKEDFSYIFHVRTVQQAMRVLHDHYDRVERGELACSNSERYKA